MKNILKFLSLLGMSVAFSVAHADGGQITGTSGTAYLERGGTQQRVTPTQTILPGDTLITENNGRVQWTMQDNSPFAMLGDSKFKVEEFSSANNRRAIFTLLKGGFRTLTGLIGKRSGDVYRVNTPVATLGVRGTRFVAVLRNGGLFVLCEDGIVIIRNAKGVLELNAGQVGFVAFDGSAPVIAGAQLSATVGFDFLITELPLRVDITVPPSNFSPRIEPSDLPNGVITPPVCPSADPSCPPVCPSSDPRCPPVCPSADPRCPPCEDPGPPECPPSPS